MLSVIFLPYSTIRDYIIPGRSGRSGSTSNKHPALPGIRSVNCAGHRLVENCGSFSNMINISTILLKCARKIRLCHWLMLVKGIVYRPKQQEISHFFIEASTICGF